MAVAVLLASAPAAAQPEPASEPAADSAWFREAEQERDDREAYRRELEANYRSNKLGLSLALRRASVKLPRTDEPSWGGGVFFDFFIPLQDGVSPMWLLNAGFEAYPVEGGTLGTMAASFAYGFRTPAFMGYAGGTFGAALPIGDFASEGGYLFGALAGVGVDFGRVNLRAEGRWEKGLFRAGQTATVLSISPVLGITF